MTNGSMRVFLGYDSKEPIAFHVAMHSIFIRASVPVSVTPLVQAALRSGGIYTRERGSTESTEFSLTRFLCPFLSGYDGYSLFLDCDILFLTDVVELLAYGLAYPDKAVFVVQHDYKPKTDQKFLGQAQTSYPRKNWSSVMLFNNSRCRALTPKYINSATGLELHRFMWIKDEEIGSLPLEFNHLVGEYETATNAKILHYTLGTPCFPEYANCDNSKEWWAERDAMLGVK